MCHKFILIINPISSYDNPINSSQILCYRHMCRPEDIYWMMVEHELHSVTLYVKRNTPVGQETVHTHVEHISKNESTLNNQNPQNCSPTNLKIFDLNKIQIMLQKIWIDKMKHKWQMCVRKNIFARHALLSHVKFLVR